MKRFQTQSLVSSLFLSLALGVSACGQGGTEEIPECGDGLVEGAEQCDDGNALSGDGCSSTCEVEEEDECGDGIQGPTEGCDDGNLVSGDGCSAVCIDEGASQAEQIDQYIQSLDQLPSQERVDPTFGEILEEGPDSTNPDYDCVKQEFVQIEKNVEISTFAANSSNLFPGALVHGNSLYNDLIDPKILPLKPVTFSVSLSNLNGSTTGVMQTPNIDQYRTARNAILAEGVSGDVVANTEPEVIEVNSKEELSIALGVDVNTATVDVGADFNFTNNEERSHFVIRVKQVLFTVDTVLPSKPSDLLGDAVTLEEIQSSFNDEDPAMYVQQLIYGRLIYFTFESKVSAQELKAALDFAFNNGVQVNATSALDFQQILEQTTIKGYVIGGSASADVTSLIGGSIDGIKTFIQQNLVFPADNFNNFGDIIGFKLGYLSDNSTAALSFGGETTVRQCVRARQKVDVELLGIEAISDGAELGDELEIFGNVTTQGNANAASLFSRSSSTRIDIPLGDAFGATQQEISASPGIGSLQTAQVTVDLVGALKLTADLREFDAGSADELLRQTNTITASQGWRGVKTVQAIVGGTQANVHFRLTPVFE